jgi:hypothetical protein
VENWRLWPSSQNLTAEKSAQGGCRKCPPSNSKRPKKNIRGELLQCSEKEGGAFLSRIITDDEAWVDHCDPLKKRQSMGWLHQSLAHNKKLEVETFAVQVMATIVGDSEGTLLVELLERDSTINSEKLKPIQTAY